MYELRCLGEATLRSPSGQLVHFRSRKHFALLTYLALNADRAHRRDRLAGLLWSETDESRARHSLSQALYGVKRILDGAVRIEGDDLELSSERLHVDALELQRRLDVGDVAAAADLYRGEFLEGFWIRGAHGFEEWASRERSRLGALARDALRRAIKVARERCDWSDVSVRAARLVRQDPFDEAAHCELMRALWMLGDRSAALERYEELKTMLAAELQTVPSREAEALAGRIRQRPVRGGWSQGRRVRETAGAVLEEPPFVGRQHELAALAAQWEPVAAGESRTVALVGPAGIGKTRLADQFIGSLELSDVTVLRSCCYEAEQTLPYGPVAEALRRGVAGLEIGDVNPLWIAELARIVPEVRERYADLPEPPPLDAEGSRRRLYEGIARVLMGACETRPLLLFIDDLHWADDSSLALLHYAHRRVTNGLYLLLAYRPEELDDDPGAVPALLSAESPHIRTIRVDGLDVTASCQLVNALMGEHPDPHALASVQRRSGGNPFFAIELARAFVEGEVADASEARVPESIRSLLERRFARLSERTGAFLQQAACLGARFRPAELRSAVGLAPFEFDSMLRELERASIVSLENDVVHFRHTLIREVAWERVPVVLHSALHLRAARALINLGSDDEGEIAVHLAEAGDDRRAYAYALRGADAAEAHFALEEAADLLALAIPRAPNERSRMSLVGRLGKVHLHMRDYVAARPLLEKRLEYVRRKGDDELAELRARRDVVFLDMWSSAITVRESADRLKKLYGDVKDSSSETAVLQADILTKLFWAAARCFDPALVEEAIAEARRLHAQYKDPAVRCRTGRSIGIYERYRGRLSLAEKYLTAAVRSARDAGDHTAIVDCYVGLTTLLPRTMQTRMADEILDTALPLAEEHADPWHVTAILCNCAASYMYAGNAGRARGLLEQARRTMQCNGEIPDTSPSLLYNLGFVESLDGNYDLAERYWTSALRSGIAHGVLPAQQQCLAALGMLALRRQEIAKARGFAAHALRLARRGTFLVDQHFELHELVARLRYTKGRKAKSFDELKRIAGAAQSSDIPLHLTMQLTRLELTLREGLRKEARGIMSELSEVARRHGAVWYLERAQDIQAETRRGKRK